MDKIRLNKFLSGRVSRRAADACIAEGRVRVNGETVTQMGVMIDPSRDSVTLDGEKILPERGRHVYIMLNKPAGFVSTAKDQFGRGTVMDLIEAPRRVFPVGRLDYDTEGLLLLTSDGAFAEKILRPRYEIKKTYVVTTGGAPPEEALAALRRGVLIDGGAVTSPAEVSARRVKNGAEITIIIHEGRNRQVRKMCAAAGLSVRRLRRSAVGRLTLGGLAVGGWRNLTKDEIKYFL
ncbi:MAG: rRNA pseudouridine synthase [Clostridiales bacterium]|jgi:pseudouridine synthase|nr:rRNA pseudouridine synthase [Clostridiales bacterium]